MMWAAHREDNRSDRDCLCYPQTGVSAGLDAAEGRQEQAGTASGHGLHLFLWTQLLLEQSVIRALSISGGNPVRSKLAGQGRRYRGGLLRVVVLIARREVPMPTGCRRINWLVRSSCIQAQLLFHFSRVVAGRHLHCERVGTPVGLIGRVVPSVGCRRSLAPRKNLHAAADGT